MLLINVSNNACFLANYRRNLRFCHGRRQVYCCWGGGGDFNVILDQDLDGRGGNKKRKDSVRYVEDIIIEHDLVEIWRIRNPTDTRFTRRQKSPLIQRRLDYWLTSNDLQEDVESVEIITAIRSDHSAITLSVNGLDV